MAKKARKKFKQLDFDPYDDFDGYEDEVLDVRELSRNIHDKDWGDFQDSKERLSARRKIERRNEFKKLYSQLDEWTQFGDRAEW